VSAVPFSSPRPRPTRRQLAVRRLVGLGPEPLDLSGWKTAEEFDDVPEAEFEAPEGVHTGECPVCRDLGIKVSGQDRL
jgi:hypothetical protein